MKFSDLLKDGQKGTRRCDKWLAENISDKKHSWYADPVYLNGERHEPILFYTTGNSIDPIFNLACDFVGHEEGKIELNADRGSSCCILQNYGLMEKPIKSNFRTDPKIAVADALFKSYHVIQENKNV